MPLIPLPNASIVNVQMFGMLNAQRIINLFQYQPATAPNPGTDYASYLDGLFTAVTDVGSLYEKFLEAMPDNYTLNFIRLQPVAPARLRFIDYPQGALGGAGNNAKTSNLASSVERFGRQNGRRGIGRVQLPTPDNTYTAGILNIGAYTVKLDALALAMTLQQVSIIPSLTWFPVIHNTAASQPLTEVVFGASRKETVRTMHRRTVGLGI